MSYVQTSTSPGPLVAQWIEHLPGDQKVAGSILVWQNKVWVAVYVPTLIIKRTLISLLSTYQNTCSNFVMNIHEVLLIFTFPPIIRTADISCRL